ncbi:hypothetical protein ACWDG1_41195 [Streptomyces sp. NPDC001177]
MGREFSYPEELRKVAVAWFRAASGKRTYAAVAAELGMTGETLRTWARRTAPAHVRAPRGRCRPDSGWELARLQAEKEWLLKAEKAVE